MFDSPVFEDPAFVLAVLAFAVAISDWLCRRTFLRHVGTSLLVIVVAAVLANAGVIPVYDAAAPLPLYDGLFTYGVYVGIFWLLLRVNLADVRKAGAPMLILFAIGALGTVVGVFTAMTVVGGASAFGEHYRGLGGMFVATYTGGSANLNILAAEYGVARDGLLYTGANAVDAILTTVWMIASIAVPRLLWRVLPRRKVLGVEEADGAVTDEALDTESLAPIDIAILLALGTGAYWASVHLTDALNVRFGLAADARSKIPVALVLTTIALALAQVPAVARLKGARLLGMLAVYLFLAVIGVLCDLSALERLGELAGTLWVFAAVVIAVHGLVCFGLAAVFKLDWDMAAVASQANVGGGSTALALARSLGRRDLVLPGILIGCLGTAAGTYLGMLTARFLP